MSNELSAEEQAAADKLKAEAKEEKTKIEQIGDDLADVTTMLKSVVEKKEEADSEEKKEIDYSAIVPEKLAKSLVESDDKEKTVDFIARLTEGCNLMPQDMIGENGEPFVNAEMMKSLEDATDEGKQFLSGILYSMQEANERTAKVNAVNMQLMSTLVKSLQGLTEGMKEMEKSFVKPVEKKADVVAELPEFTENTSAEAISEATGDDLGAPTIHRDVAVRAIKKSFKSEDQNEYIKQTTYCGLVATHGYEAAITKIPLDDVSIIQSNLPA
jgi:hypothetical protein